MRLSAAVFLLLLMLPALAFADPVAIERQATLGESYGPFFPALVLETIVITFLVRKTLGKQVTMWLFALIWFLVTNVTWVALTEFLMAFETYGARTLEIALGELVVVFIETIVLRMILIHLRSALNPLGVPSWYKCLGISALGNAVSLASGIFLEIAIG